MWSTPVKNWFWKNTTPPPPTRIIKSTPLSKQGLEFFVIKNEMTFIDSLDFPGLLKVVSIRGHSQTTLTAKGEGPLNVN